MDDEKTQTPEQQNAKFQKEVMLYLRNLAAWKHTFSEGIKKLNNRIDVIEIKLCEILEGTQKLGRACHQAFSQTKEVINALSEEAKSTREDLAEYGGVICEDTWCGKVRVV